MKKNLLTVAFLGLTSLFAQAQDDLLSSLENEAKAEKQFTKSTFKATRLINGHTFVLLYNQDNQHSKMLMAIRGFVDYTD
jgi:hypothetical protein